jgi:hypothetical protein
VYAEEIVEPLPVGRALELLGRRVYGDVRPVVSTANAAASLVVVEAEVGYEVLAFYGP